MLETAAISAPAQAAEMPPGSAPARGVTARSILLGAVLVPLNCFWVIRMERVSFGPYPSTVSLFANVVFVLFVLVAVNTLLQRWLPKLAFSQPELLVLYTMLAVSTGLAGLDGVSSLCQIIPHGAWAATPSSHFDSILGAFPPWLVVSDKAVLSGHYLGHSSFYQPAVLRAWASPILAWTGFVTLLLFVAQCLNVLVHPQWGDSERLTFPIIRLPMAMTENGVGTTFFRDRIMWAGFALAAGMSFWNGLALFVPTWPAIHLDGMDLRPLMTQKPWTAITWFPITFYPFVIGLGFLLPLDLLFSCVFFYLFWNAQVAAANQMAWDSVQGSPFVTEQGFGAVLGLFLSYAWSGRKHYAAIWRQARQGSGASETGEALSARTALLGISGGLGGLLLFGHAAGASWWVVAAFLLLYLATVLVVARIRAELGAPVHDFHFMGSDSMIPRVFGAEALRPGDMAFFTFAYGLERAHRADTMPIGLEGLKMARQGGFEARRMFGAVILATVLGCLGTFWAFEHQAYQLGTAAHFNSGDNVALESFHRMVAWTRGGQDARPDTQAASAIGVGLVCSLLLFALRLRFVGFPLHPIGYAISSSWAIHLIWFPMLIAWALKGLTLRYGGYGAYRRAVPLFLGLVLGDCVMGSVWGLIGLVFNTHTYNFFGS